MLAERILVFDGGTGTALFPMNLTAEHFGGEAYDGCPEALCLQSPDVVRSVHRGYLEAGADIIETNTFGGTPIVLDEFSLAGRAHDVNVAAARLACEMASEYSRGGRTRIVAGAMGPTTKTLSVTGGSTFDGMCESYRCQALGLIEGGVDLLLIETCLDTLNAKSALSGARQALAEFGIDLPIMLSCTIEQMGTMLAGQSVESFFTSMEHALPLSVGMNCSTGPEFMTDHIRALSELAWTYVSCYPNAGLPNEDGEFDETPETFCATLDRFVEQGWLNFVGGCCGTHQGHIRALTDMVSGRPPRRPPSARRLAVSGVDFLQPDKDNRPIIVGERTNVIGSRKFKKLIAQDDFERASEIGRKQMKGGAQVLDVCLANPDRDELSDTVTFLSILTKKVRLPLMIDTTDARVLEEAMKLCQGKVIVNSINLEDGEKRFAQVAPLVRAYGGAVIVGCIDEDPEQGMAITVERKLEIARRSHALLTRKYGLPERDLIFDPLVFPCGTGDPQYVGSAAATIEGVRAITEALPGCSTILGISNVSFGLPPAGREVLNAVFLYHCTKAGLGFAIVNSERLERYASIPEAERQAAEDLIFARRDDAVDRFAALFRDRTPRDRKKDEWAGLSLDERLASRIVEGTREGQIKDLDEALKDRAPLAIINGPLMDGMDEVGRLFAANELIVSEVLQSAEVMKASVAHLETFMEKANQETRGTLLLATVKGDVHDIGKNLVEIILSNNGFRVINLGIKVPSDRLIEAYREHRPDAIGLSGLLVKSAQQMVSTVSDFGAAGVNCPVLVGGAALTRQFAATRIAPSYGEAPALYAKDAMDGLSLMKQLSDPASRDSLLEKNRKQQEQLRGERARRDAASADSSSSRTGPKTARASVDAPPSGSEIAASEHPCTVSLDVDRPEPPDLQRHVLLAQPLEDITPYLNPQMLYGKHLGLKGRFEKLRAKDDPRAVQLERLVNQLLEEAKSSGWMKVNCVYRFFPVRAEGNDLIVLAPGNGSSESARFTFPRQPSGARLCLSDFCATGPGPSVDHVAMFVTTAGTGVRERVEELKGEGEYLKMHALQALAIELAEAAAEWLHADLRRQWGFPDPEGMTMSERFRCRYRGVRVSFGYPACPDLADQATLFELLQPEEVGVQLTDGFMMEPEASVSALVFHHPEARYFNAGVDYEVQLGTVSEPSPRSEPSTRAESGRVP